MELGLTGTETAAQLIKQLVYLRHLARRNIMLKQMARDRIRQHEQDHAAAAANSAAQAIYSQAIAILKEQELEISFQEIEIGKYLVHLCPALDSKASREAIFEAINTNKADRDTEDVRKYGDKCSNLIFVLDLENSATKDDDIVHKPLKWCHTMAFMNALQTNPKLDRIVHEEANEVFGGAFGEYQERPLTERLVGRAV
ncbi:hypothetical protein [Delftia acidovorans]|uniref:hypothetical protein n=1 Tax=Delftia acidovorans TaxID=80866 RepID=UPI00034E62D3|nr:hypothetical protein [Delftia acidovorans]EPD35551.1 hypothetical protein HMPREF9702_05925 [Delftia acidovorans CCUG 15835]